MKRLCRLCACALLALAVLAALIHAGRRIRARWLVPDMELAVLRYERVRDAPSGFRAFSRDALQRIFLHSHFSYCMETLIQAGATGMRVASVDVRVNPKTRDSRLFTSIPQYLRRTGGTMLAMFVLYRPGTFFTCLSVPFWLAALFLGCKYLWLVYVAERVGARFFLPTLVLLLLCATLAFLLDTLAIVGALLAANRHLAEEEVSLLRKSQGKIVVQIPAERK